MEYKIKLKKLDNRGFEYIDVKLSLSEQIRLNDSLINFFNGEIK